MINAYFICRALNTLMPNTTLNTAIFQKFSYSISWENILAISREFAPKDPLDKSILVQVMIWRRAGYKL